MRQIKIDFTKDVPRKQTGDWGKEGEHNETVLECVLSDSFSQCEYINAEFETASHKKIVLDELKPEGNILMVPLIQQVTVEGRLKMQLVGYMLNEKTYELEAVSKTDLVTGNIAKGIDGICEECNPEPSFMELLWAKVRKLWDMRHSHPNQEILDKLTENGIGDCFNTPWDTILIFDGGDADVQVAVLDETILL